MSSSQPTSTPPSVQVATETITRVRVPMLRPRPDLLKVLRLAGGFGETFTMKEIISLVKDYIQERKMYDENDPRVVYCHNDLLGKALGVETFTVMQAISLFQRNCSVEPDSCISVHRQLTTRPVAPPVEPGTGQNRESAVNPTVPLRGASNGVENPIMAEMVEMHDDSSVADLAVNGSEATQSGTRPTQRDLSSVSSSQSPLQNTQNQVTDSVETSVSSTFSSTPPSTYGSVSLSTQSQPMQSSLPSSSSSAFVESFGDEVDGDVPFCQVTVETQGVDHAQDDTVMVNYDSDAFSVEYEVESSTDTEMASASQSAVGHARSSRRACTRRTCSDSDLSSTTSTTAILVVCEESDVEYLADYSDTDRGSDNELSDGDKWHCCHCNIKNPPIQRNCSGCWSVRPDWLPTAKSGVKETDRKEEDESLDDRKTDLDTSAIERVSQDSALERVSQDSALERVSQDSALSSCKSSLDAELTSTKKRKYSSSLSDSQDDRARSVKKVSTSAYAQKAKERHHHKNKSSESSSSSCVCQDPCIICYSKSKNACLIHGKTSHQVCCYSCAKRLKAERRSCPVCRRPIQKVVRNFFTT